MNIQIFGKSKCFDTKKAERYFKERGIKFQSVDILSKGLSKGELDSVCRAVGGLEKLIDESSKDYCNIKYLLDGAKADKLAECPKLYRTPIVRNGKQATVGYCPEIWEKWEKGVTILPLFIFPRTLSLRAFPSSLKAFFQGALFPRGLCGSIYA